MSNSQQIGRDFLALRIWPTFQKTHTLWKAASCCFFCFFSFVFYIHVIYVWLLSKEPHITANKVKSLFTLHYYNYWLGPGGQSFHKREKKERKIKQ